MFPPLNNSNTIKQNIVLLHLDKSIFIMYEYTDFNEFNSLNNYYDLQICEYISFNKNKLYMQSFLYMKKN